MSALAQDRPYVRSVGDEPLPGYRLIAPLGMGGFGEVWKCLAPGGLHKAIKFVHADDDGRDGGPTSLQQEYEAFERVKGIRHPFLMTLERVELAGGELVMVMELADRSLGNRYDECRAAGHAGIPRSELLSYMVDAAEALDVLGRQHGLQHLDVKPANLFILGGHVKVGDYGLVARHKASHNGDEARLGRGLTPKYVAPEVIHDRVDARSDQYPLALVYQELLTGVFPFPGRTARQLLMQHASAEPDLAALPAQDRETVRRALAKDPAHRFTSCLSFVKSLLRGDAAEATQVVTTTTRTLPTPPQGSPRLPSARPALAAALVTPSARQSGALNVETTLRFNPTLATSPEIRFPADSEFGRHHPGWTFVAEGPATPRGRVVRVSDECGEFHSVHLVKWPAAQAARCEPVALALARPARLVFQAIQRPHAHTLSLAVPEKCRTLADDLGTRKAADEPPLRRAEIRAVLAPVAAALDAVHARNAFAHGLLSPAAIVLKDAAWGVALYGMGELLRRSRADRDWIAADPYAAPEAAIGEAVPASDQYSLALVFLELAGAWLPPERPAARVERGAVRFQRDAFAAYERTALAKALAASPEHRFPTCGEFLAALEPPTADGVALEEVRVVECVNRLAGGDATPQPMPRPQRLTDALLLAAGADAVASWPSPQSEALVVRLPDGRLASRFPARLPTELALLKMKDFKELHHLDLTRLTTDTYILKPRLGIPHAGGRGIELVVQLPRGEQAGAGEPTVTGRSTAGCDRSRADETVIHLIEQFRRALQNATERRKAARFRTDLPIRVFPLDDELSVGAPLAGKCRDVSATGFACVLPGALATEHAFVTFPTLPEFAPWALLAKVVRTAGGVAGSAVVAGRFVHAGA